jgi:hypothetical protein
LNVAFPTQFFNHARTAHAPPIQKKTAVKLATSDPVASAILIVATASKETMDEKKER